MTCTLGGGGLIQYHVQFMCSIIYIYDRANIGGAIAPPAPRVPTPMLVKDRCNATSSFCDAICSGLPHGELADVLGKRMIIATVKFICQPVHALERRVLHIYEGHNVNTDACLRHTWVCTFSYTDVNVSHKKITPDKTLQR